MNWCVVSPRGNGHYLVVRQSWLGVASVWFTQWAYSYTWWQPRWTYCELQTDRGCLVTRLGFLTSTCKAIDFWRCNTRVRGKGGGGPGRPSGVPQGGTWITIREEARSEGGCTSNIQILGGTAIDNQVASEEVVWMFFLRVGVCIGLLGVTVGSISSWEIGTRHWMGEQGAAAVVAAEECTNNVDLKWQQPAHRDTNGRLDSGTWPYGGEPFPIWAAADTFIPLHILYELRTNVHQQKIFPSWRNGSVSVDALHPSRQRHPGGGILRGRSQSHPSRVISLSDRSFTIPSHSVGLLFETDTVAWWPTVTMRRNGLIGYMLASALQCNGWRCDNLLAFLLPASTMQFALYQ